MATSPKGSQNGQKPKREAFGDMVTKFGKRWFIRLGVLALLVIAVIESYVQIRGVALHYRRPALNASLIPISLDIFGVMAAMKARESGNTRVARIIARICMWGAIAASLAINIQAGILSSNGLSGIDLAWSLFLSAIPALCVLGTSEMLTHTHKGATPNSAKAAQNGLIGLLAGKLTKATQKVEEVKPNGLPRQRSKPTNGTSGTKKANAAKADTVPQTV